MAIDEATWREALQLCNLLWTEIDTAEHHLYGFNEASASAVSVERERTMPMSMPAMTPAPGPGVNVIAKWYEARREMARTLRETGEIPRSDIVIHAKGFVTALASVQRALKALAKLDTGSARPAMQAARDSLSNAIPGLRLLRDSIEHAEDRARGLVRGDELPLAKDYANVPAHDLMEYGSTTGDGGYYGASLDENRYGATVEDGKRAEVEVSEKNLEAAYNAVRDATNALPPMPVPEQPAGEDDEDEDDEEDED